MSLLSNYGILFTIIIVMIFGQLNRYLYDKPYLIPNSVQNIRDIKVRQFKFWKWRNIIISFIHSLISAFADLLALFCEPLLALNMMDTYSELAYIVISFSNGYFMYDLMLSLLNITYRGRIEIIVHHFVTISILTYSTVTKQFIGYCMTALVVEISNIFLHLRQLFRISGINMKSKTFRMNSIITIFSLIITRIFPLSWIVFCLFMEEDLRFVVWLLATIGAIVILIVSIGITVRVAYSDFIRKQ